MIKWAIVTSVTPFKVRFDGESVASEKVYKRPKTYTPVLDDRVCFFVQGNQYTCLGAYV